MSYGTSPLQGTAPQQCGPKKVTFAQHAVFLGNMTLKISGTSSSEIWAERDISFDLLPE
jgi:hypothetical protein